MRWPFSPNRVIPRRPCPRPASRSSSGASPADGRGDRPPARPDLVDPEAAARVVEERLVTGLDIAGIDVVADDIGCPLEDQGGAIVEVNSEPALSMHMNPTSGMPRPVIRVIIDLMFPGAEDGRIPIVAVTGTDGTVIDHPTDRGPAARDGQTIGRLRSDGMYVDRRRIAAGDCSGPRVPARFPSDPRVEAAVLETAPGGVFTDGLGFDRCAVAVVERTSAMATSSSCAGSKTWRRWPRPRTRSSRSSPSTAPSS